MTHSPFWLVWDPTVLAIFKIELRPYSRLCDNIKVWRSNLLNVVFCYCRWNQKQLHLLWYIDFATFWLAGFLNSFDYILDQKVDRTLAFVAKWKSYHCIWNIFFLFRLHARSGSRPQAYSRLCGKIKVLPLHFKYFFVSMAKIKNSCMFFVIFWFIRHSGLREF